MIEKKYCLDCGAEFDVDDFHYCEYAQNFIDEENHDEEE